MIKGDHVEASGVLITHHGVYVGDGLVACYCSESGKLNARVEVVPITEFARGRPVRVLNRPAVFGPDEIVSRALTRHGEQQYSLWSNNCEHFVNWCRTGRTESRQADRVVERTVSVSTKVAARAVTKGASKAVAKAGSKVAAKRLTRAASPLLLLADAAQLGTELVMAQSGSKQEDAEGVGQAVGLVTSLVVGGIAAGPVGIAFGFGFWVLGELAGKCVTSRSGTDDRAGR
jgi:hypothetical protein